LLGLHCHIVLTIRHRILISDKAAKLRRLLAWILAILAGLQLSQLATATNGVSGFTAWCMQLTIGREELMKRKHKANRDVFKAPKKFHTIRAAINDKADLKRAQMSPSFTHLLISPSQPHSKMR
jgi:hypothetical protein